MVSNSELEALELLVKAGRIVSNVAWTDAAPQAAEYIIDLAKRIVSEREPSQDNLSTLLNMGGN